MSLRHNRSVKNRQVQLEKTQEKVCEPYMENFEGQGSRSQRRRWHERPILGGHSTGMRQEWETDQHKPDAEHYQLFCWEFSIASFTVRSTEAREKERGRRETAVVVSSFTPAFPGGASTVSSLICCIVVTCGIISDDSQPGRLIGLSYIIGHFTYILSALLLSHIVEGQDLSIRAIDPRMLEIKTSHVQHRKKANAGSPSLWRLFQGLK